MITFLIQIGPRATPRLSFECMAAHSVDAATQHAGLCQPGEAMRVTALLDARNTERAVNQRRESLLTSPAS